MMNGDYTTLDQSRADFKMMHDVRQCSAYNESKSPYTRPSGRQRRGRKSITVLPHSFFRKLIGLQREFDERYAEEKKQLDAMGGNGGSVGDGMLTGIVSSTGTPTAAADTPTST
jgi:hypothetical protein